MDFLTSYNLLHKTQSGFRPAHSCETALLSMINKWLDAINNGSMVGAVMIDFKKAFDFVDHSFWPWWLSLMCRLTGDQEVVG